MKPLIVLLFLVFNFFNVVNANYLSFKNANIKDVAFAVSQITNKNIVITSDINANVDLFAPNKVSDRELLNLFYSAVISSGLSFEIGRNSIYVKALDTTLLNNPSLFRSRVFKVNINDSLISSLPEGSFSHPVDGGLLVHTSPLYLSLIAKIEANTFIKKDEVITRVFNLKTVKPSSLYVFIPESVKFVAYDKINKLVVNGLESEVQIISNLINKLDGSLSVYQVELVITSVDKSHSDIYNLNLSIADSIGGIFASGGLSFGTPHTSSSLLLNWIESQSYFNLEAKPYLQLLDGHSSSLVIGHEVPFKVSTIDPDSKQITTIERRNVGLLLDVSIGSLSTGKVRLDLYQEFSSISNFQVLEHTDIIINKQSLRTTLDLILDHFYLIGGLSFNTNQELEVSNPLFKNHTVLDMIFTDTDNQSVERDLLIFIKVSKVSGTNFVNQN